MISKGRVIRTGLFFAFTNFLITATIGFLIRHTNVIPISGFADSYWIHAHSHVGFLGWVFTALFILGYGMLLPKNRKINGRVYRLLIYFQIAVLGMLVTFPIMGYAAPSIIFSTLHLILSIVYAIIFFKNADRNDLASKFMKAALVFMLISSLGPLVLGPVIVMGLKGTPWYDMSIYFYLHFQYNGWFALAVMALLIKQMEHMGIQIDKRKGKLILKLLVYGIILTLALSALGFGFSLFVNIVGFVGAVLQVWAGVILVKMLFFDSKISKFLISNWVKWFLGVALFSWLLKIIMQLLSAFPAISDFAFINRDAIMTYLHLSFLGTTSCFLIGLLIVRKNLSVSNLISRVGFGLFIAGVVLMEVIIGMKSLPQYLSLEIFLSIKYLLFADALILFISIFILLFFAFILPNRTIKQKRFI